MPTYDYVCLDCNKEFEYFQKMTDEQLTECPECNGKLKRRIGTGLSPIFKGSGFYQTDYKKNTSTASGSEGSTPKPKTETKSTDSPKPDAAQNTGDKK